MSGRVSIRSCPLSSDTLGVAVTCQRQGGVGFHSSAARSRGRETLAVVGVPDRFLDRASREPAVVVGKLIHQDKIAFSGRFKYNLRTLAKW